MILYSYICKLKVHCFTYEKHAYTFALLLLGKPQNMSAKHTMHAQHPENIARLQETYRCSKAVFSLFSIHVYEMCCKQNF